MKKNFHELLAGGRALGAFIQLPSPEVVEIFGSSGYDFVFVDNEHTEIDEGSSVALVRAAEAVDCCALIRTADESATRIKKALDTGAAGVLVPGIESAQMARDVVYNAKYAPDGMRGACPGVRANGYGRGGEEYYAQANRDTAVLIQVEGAGGFAEFDQILEVKGLDGVLLGPVDLSMALGVPGQVNHPQVIGAMREMVQKANAKGVKCGTFCMDQDAARGWLDAGMDFIAYHIDTMLLRAAAAEAARQYKALLD